MIKVDLNVDLRKIQYLTFPELKEYIDVEFLDLFVFTFCIGKVCFFILNRGFRK